MKQIGVAIVATTIWGCLLYLIVNSGWQTWICWVAGIITILLWAFSIFAIWCWYILETQILPGIKSGWNHIKEEYGVNSFGEFIINMLQKLYY